MLDQSGLETGLETGLGLMKKWVPNRFRNRFRNRLLKILVIKDQELRRIKRQDQELRSKSRA